MDENYLEPIEIEKTSIEKPKKERTEKQKAHWARLELIRDELNAKSKGDKLARKPLTKAQQRKQEKEELYNRLQALERKLIEKESAVVEEHYYEPEEPEPEPEPDCTTAHQIKL